MPRIIATFGFIALLSFQFVTDQESRRIVSVFVPVWGKDLYNTEFFRSFRAIHPDVDVVVKVDDWGVVFNSIPNSFDLQSHLTTTHNLASQSDVIYADDTTLSVESSRAGDWLNLAPLANADPEFRADTFLPAVWRAFQWDNGVWAIPHTFRIIVLGYNQAAFDAAGLSYPNADWTIDDFVKATVALTQRDANGKVTRLGFYDNPVFLRSLLGRNYWEITVNGLESHLSDPDLANILDVWAPTWYDNAPGQITNVGVPLQIVSLFSFEEAYRANDSSLTIAPLPGNSARVRVDGFAVSRGAADPQLAYELATFMAQQSGLAYAEFLSSNPAWGVTGFDDLTLDLVPEDQATVRSLMPNLLGNQEMLFRNYIDRATERVGLEDISAEVALQQVQQLAASNLTQAQAFSSPIAIASPFPTAIPSDSEITIQFGISSSIIPNKPLWDNIASEMAAADPQIGQIVINSQGLGSGDYEIFMANNDCYYLTYSATDESRISEYFPLDPFVNADPDLTPEDFLLGTLAALQLNGTTWGYPLNMEVVTLEVNPSTLQTAGIPMPRIDWTIDEFTATLAGLKSVEDRTDLVPLGLRSYAIIDLLALMAAFGGIPVEYQSNPPQVELTSTQNIEAIRQVLNLAKEGFIDYHQLGAFVFSPPSRSHAINMRELQFGSESTDQWGYVNYPRGSQYNVLTLANVGGLYINKNAQNPDACYRWIRTVALHPELLYNTMPVTMASLDDVALINSQGQVQLDFYRSVATLASQPNTVVFYDQIVSLENNFTLALVGKAFDQYVLEHQELEPILTTAQGQIDNFQACIAAAPITDGSQAQSDSSDTALQCLVGVDADLFSKYQAAAQGA